MSLGTCSRLAEMDNYFRLYLLLATLMCCHLSKSKSCWKKYYCHCKGNATTTKTIYCRKVRNFLNVEQLFHNRTPVHWIRIHGSFDTLPGRAFDRISVNVLSLNLPLRIDQPEDLLSGIRDLKVVDLNNTLFNRIPKAFSYKNLKEFSSVRGNLDGLDTQLQNMPRVTKIDLSSNRITHITEDAFFNSTNIKQLNLSRNEIENLHPGIFEANKFIEDIDLSFNRLHTMDGHFKGLNPVTINLYRNNLTSLDGLFHSKMFKLKSLDLGGNANLHLTSTSFDKNLTALVDLNLSECNIKNVTGSFLGNLGNLHNLYLNDNKLSFLPKDFLENTPFVNMLQLRNNRLQSMDGVRMSNGSKIHLAVDGNELTTLALAKRGLGIYNSDMSRNHIDGIREKDMVALQSSVFLNLSNNDISFIEATSFYGFRRLQQLDLSHNPLSSLNRSLQGLVKMHSLYIRCSRLSKVSLDDFLGSQPSKIDLHNNRLESVQGAFRQMKYITHLDLSSNNLSTLTAESFLSFQRISIRVRRLRMADNPWSCDCRLSWFAKWVRRSGSKLLDEPICHSPAHLRGLFMRNISLSDFESWPPENCPPGCECRCLLQETRMFAEVRCTNRGLTREPSMLPTQTKILDLRENGLESFNFGDILWMQHLERLDLEHNMIQEVRLAFPPKLSSLRLAHNRLRVFPLDQWSDNALSVQEISLSHNPWICNCDTWNFRLWLWQHNESIVDVKNVRCGSEASIQLRKKVIIYLSRDELCFSLYPFIVISACCLLLLMCFIICFCCRQSIAAWLYSAGCTCLKRKPQTEEQRYDAFLLYSQADEDLAVGKIAHELENRKKPYRLCIPSRDISAPQTEQKLKTCLAQCSKVIVVVSRSFTSDIDCTRRMITAMSFSPGSHSKYIVFVTHGDLVRSELDPVMKNLLKSCLRLRWGSCLFWEKLMYQLPKKTNGGENKEQQPCSPANLTGGSEQTAS